MMKFLTVQRRFDSVAVVTESCFNSGAFQLRCLHNMLTQFVYAVETLSTKSTFSSYIPESFFLTRQLRRSQTSVTAGFIGIHFFRVVQQPPRGAAKSTLRPKTSALTP